MLSRAFLTCWTAAWRAWAATKARSAANSIRWRTSFRLARHRRFRRASHHRLLAGVFVDRPQLGWFIASIYLLCGAFRLARFNCLAAMSGGGGGKEFLGFPIPAAAGLVASLTLFLLWIEEKGFSQSKLRFVLPVA